MINIGCEYNIKEDINFILETERINSADLSERTKVSRTTLDGIQKKGKARDDVCEKIYSYAYENKYRIILLRRTDKRKISECIVSRFQVWFIRSHGWRLKR